MGVVIRKRLMIYLCPQRKKKKRRRWRIAVSRDTQSGWMWSRLGRQLTGFPGGLTKPRVSPKRTARIQTDRCFFHVSLLLYFAFHIHSKYAWTPLLMHSDHFDLFSSVRCCLMTSVLPSFYCRHLSCSFAFLCNFWRSWGCPQTLCSLQPPAVLISFWRTFLSWLRVKCILDLFYITLRPV